MNINNVIKGKAGIYRVVNLTNNKFYIGSSKSLYQRAYSYKCLAKQGKIHNQHLQYSINKYGVEKFVFEVIEYIENIEFLHEREQYYIDTLKPQYNKKLIVESNIGVKLSTESRQKISDSLKKAFENGTKKVNRLQVHNIKVALYKDDGEFIRIFPSLRDTANYLSVMYPSIKYALSSPRRVIRNHIVLYPHENVSHFIGIPINKQPYSKKVTLLDTINNKSYIFTTCKDAANYIKCKQETVKINFFKNRLVKNRYKVTQYE